MRDLLRAKIFLCVVALSILCMAAGCFEVPSLPNTPPPYAQAYAEAFFSPRPTPGPTPTPTPQITPDPTALPVPKPTPKPTQVGYRPPVGAFTPDDCVMMGIHGLDTMEKVLEELGEAELREETIDEITGVETTTLAYDGMYLSFSGGGELTNLTIVSDSWPGPRDLWVGATLEEALAAFGLTMPAPQEETHTDAASVEKEASGTDVASMTDAAPLILPAAVKDGLTVFYGDVRPNGEILAPKAELSTVPNDSGKYVLRLLSPMEPFTEQEMAKGRTHFNQHAGCSLFFDSDTDALSLIHWYIKPLAE